MYANRRHRRYKPIQLLEPKRMRYLVAVGLRLICVKYVLVNDISFSEIKLSDHNLFLLSINLASSPSDLDMKTSKAIGLSLRSCATWNKTTNDDVVKYQVEFSGTMAALLRDLPIEVRAVQNVTHLTISCVSACLPHICSKR